jgi:hypothetical protein|tara:strand:+ start:1095 stop:1571 length:477 start_codon:yes stop_codon:yes gene_type:complete
MKPLLRNFDIIFLDIDGTIVNSNHRQNAEGKPNALDLDYWIKNATRENIFKDTLMDNLVYYIKKRYLHGHYIVLCTARTLSDNDMDYLHEKGIPYHSIISRPENCSTPDAEFKYNQMKKFLNLKWTKRKKKFLYDDKWDNLIAGTRLGITPRYAHDWI